MSPGSQVKIFKPWLVLSLHLRFTWARKSAIRALGSSSSLQFFLKINPDYIKLNNEKIQIKVSAWIHCHFYTQKNIISFGEKSKRDWSALKKNFDKIGKNKCRKSRKIICVKKKERRENFSIKKAQNWGATLIKG